MGRCVVVGGLALLKERRLAPALLSVFSFFPVFSAVAHVLLGLRTLPRRDGGVGGCEGGRAVGPPGFC